MNYLQNIHQLTIPSADDGRKFTKTERLEVLQNRLATTPYTLFSDHPMTKIYAHPGFDPATPFLLISSHLDSIYHNYFSEQKGNFIYGTYDNSVTNALVLTLMEHGKLSPQTLVAFTGDEESSSEGAKQTILNLRNRLIEKNLPMRGGPSGPCPVNLSLVIVLDVTEEGYPEFPFSVENLFVSSDGNPPNPALFKTTGEMTKYLQKLLPIPFPCIIEGDPDESWEYDEFDLTCFSYCLPSEVLGEDMHDDKGLGIRIDSLAPYLENLTLLSHKALLS